MFLLTGNMTRVEALGWVYHLLQEEGMGQLVQGEAMGLADRLASGHYSEGC